MSWHTLDTCFPSRPRASNQALDLIRHSWKALAGPGMGDRTVPVSLDRRGLLVLKAWGTDTPARLTSGRTEMLKQLGSFIGEGIVRDIRWKIVPGHAEPPEPLPPPGPVPEAEGLGECISDPGLRDSFTAACRRVLGRRSPSRK
jgi:hypothetical protein